MRAIGNEGSAAPTSNSGRARRIDVPLQDYRVIVIYGGQRPRKGGRGCDDGCAGQRRDMEDNPFDHADRSLIHSRKHKEGCLAARQVQYPG